MLSVAVVRSAGAIVSIHLASAQCLSICIDHRFSRLEAVPFFLGANACSLRILLDTVSLLALGLFKPG